MLKPVELEIELFCRGMKIDDSCHVTEDGRRIARTRAGLGSGLEIVIPSPRKKIWVNVPVVEAFAEKSPLTLIHRQSGYAIVDSRDNASYPIEIPPEPPWYSRLTSIGTEMSRIGVLQGNYLGVYVSNRCLYWVTTPSSACKFCTTGKNVGTAEESRKRVSDVVEVARAARVESGAIFTHFNTGYHYEDRDDKEKMHGLRQCEPYVKAVREEVGGFIGVQAVPVPQRLWYEYDALIDAGTDHFSFCYEFEDPEWFARLCPGKFDTLGQQAFFDAMEYTAKKLGRGRVSGEIIAGLEPIEATKRGIDRIVNAGAFPTVCIFRPTIGSEMENAPPPDPEAMKDVFAYLHESCRRAGLPVGILPIEVSLVVQPEEAADLVEPSFSSFVYGMKNSALRTLAKPYIAWRTRAVAGA
ncbi:MAG TPA: radical SAM protein [Thermoanaerobaculia bacterium]|nr:radical SAM protein [Thermoanaerobaculia bacterium]